MNGPIKNALLTLLLVTIVTVTAQAGQYLPPSHDFGQQSCGACHATGTDITNAATNNVCLICHKVGSASVTNKQFFVGDMANPFGTTIESNDNKNYTHSSHEWSATDDNPAAGALPPVNPVMNTINAYNGSLSCNRCHGMHANPPKPHLLRQSVTNDELCLDCHRLRDANTHVYGTHPVNVDYNAAVLKNPAKFEATPVNSNPANPTSKPELRNGKVVCTTCHNVHYTDSSSKTLDNFSTAMVNGLLPSKGYLLKTDYRYVNYTSLNSPNICTNCHAGKHEHNGGGQRVRCTDCHSSHVDYDPFATDAQTMVPNVYMVKRYMNWSSATGWKDNKKLLTPKQTMFQDASVNRLYKRGDGKGVCQSCHEVPPEGTIAPSGNPYPGAHNIVDAKAGDCNGCHNHEGQWSFGTSCIVCHGQPPTATTAAAGYPRSEANSAHTTHYNYGYKCLECHYNGAPVALHDKGSFQDVFPNPGYVPALATTHGSSPSYSGTAFTCSAVYCHSNGVPQKGAYGNYTVVYRTTPNWFGEKTTCDSCHQASPTTNAHQAHLAKGYLCQNCHSATASGSNAIADKTKHADGLKQVQFASLSLPMPLSGNSCSTVYCHSDGANNFSNPSWTDPNTGKCGTCHDTGTRASGAHQAHLSASVPYGPKFNLYSTVSAACNTCHGPDYRTKHLNGTTIDVDRTRCTTACHANKLGSAQWTTGRTGITCESCHTGTVSSINGVFAPDKSLAASQGHNKNSSSTGVIMNYNCTSCHDDNAKHIDAAVKDTRLLPAYTGALNNECNACHNTATVPTESKKNMFTHITDYIGTSAAENTKPSACNTCHEPHGTGNRNMIRAKIVAWDKVVLKNVTCNISYNNTTSLVKTVKVGNLYTGLCQVCHTKTKFFSNYTAPQHYASGCLDCHKHKSEKTVYAFQPAGGCDGCHGYPPVQTMQVGYGHLGNYSGARLQNYSGGGGAHDVAGHVSAGARAAEVWTNCLKCHYGSDTSGNHMKGDYTKPSTVNVQVDPKYKFDSKLPITYTGNKSDDRSTYYSGSCTNVSCHFQPTPKWSNQK